MPDESEKRKEPSRPEQLRRSVWQVMRATTRRAPSDAENYGEDGPRFATNPPRSDDEDSHAPEHSGTVGEITVASFNIDHGRAVDRAIAVVRDNASLARADILLLQEMEEEGTARMAEALGMSFVYYPAGRHPVTSRHFGNAVLTRGVIINDQKHHLPHLGRVRGTRRIAVSATIRVRRAVVSAFSVHLATVLDASRRAQHEQLAHVIDMADACAGPAIIGGDLNRRSLAADVERRGYAWMTRDMSATLGPFAVDHIFVRGAETAAAHAAGVVRDTQGASDHRPVWSTFKLHE